MDAVERIFRPIVEGQIRGFLKEHPSVVEAVDWYRPRRDDKATNLCEFVGEADCEGPCVSHDAGHVWRPRCWKTLLMRGLSRPVESGSCGDRGALGTVPERASPQPCHNPVKPR
jgi:hypothetical protein